MNQHVRGRGAFVSGALIIQFHPALVEVVTRAAQHVEHMRDAAERLQATIAYSGALDARSPGLPSPAGASLRAMFEDCIEALIAFVDQLDGDTDMEPSAGESGADDECEDLHDAEVVTWPAHGPNQLRLGWGANDDDELDADVEHTWPETYGRGPLCGLSGTDDDEDDDPAGTEGDDGREPDDDFEASNARETGDGSQL